MRIEEVREAKQKIARWDALTKESNDWQRILREHLQEGSYCNLQVENKRVRETLPFSIFPEACKALRAVIEARLLAISEELESLSFASEVQS